MPEYYLDKTKLYVAVDCIILGFSENTLKILIGKRKLSPGEGEYTLNGVFVRANESLDEAAERALYELTGIRKLSLRQVGAFGTVDRDPVARVISVAYCALINVKDYKESLLSKYQLQWVDVYNMPTLFSDHNKIVEEALNQLRRDINKEPISFNLIPKLFTLTQLQHVYEAILGHEIDKRNFRKKIKQMDFLEKTDLIDKTTSKRGAALYRFNETNYFHGAKFKL